MGKKKFENLILIGGAEKDAGKTTCSEKIIRKFSVNFKLIAIKVTVLREKESGHGYSITEEKGAYPTKDTGRLLKAGAERVYWLRCDEKHAEEGFCELLSVIPDNRIILCESNSIRHYIEPALFIMVRKKVSSGIKISASSVLDFSDLFLRSVSCSNSFNYF